MITRLSMYFLLALLLCACNNLNVRRRVEILDGAIEQYNVALRWAFYHEVEAFHMTRDGTRPEIDFDALEDIRVTGYSISEKIVNDDVTEATVKGTIEYYNTGRGTLKKAEFDHKWWYNTELKRWFIETGFPQFR